MNSSLIKSDCVSVTLQVYNLEDRRQNRDNWKSCAWENLLYLKYESGRYINEICAARLVGSHFIKIFKIRTRKTIEFDYIVGYIAECSELTIDFIGISEKKNCKSIDFSSRCPSYVPYCCIIMNKINMIFSMNWLSKTNVRKKIWLNSVRIITLYHIWEKNSMMLMWSNQTCIMLFSFIEERIV